jgi:hypothetical protein
MVKKVTIRFMEQGEGGGVMCKGKMKVKVMKLAIFVKSMIHREKSKGKGM